MKGVLTDLQKVNVFTCIIHCIYKTVRRCLLNLDIETLYQGESSAGYDHMDIEIIEYFNLMDHRLF